MTLSQNTSLAKKIVFITGASSGIGKASAEAFAAAGAQLILTARRLDRLQALAQQLKEGYGTQSLCLALDVTDKNSVVEQVAALPAAWQNIAVLVNNAGLAKGFDYLQEGKVEDWEAMIDTNIKGLLYLTRQILPGMLQRRLGHIINIGSIAGVSVYAKGAVYCATKYAVRALSKALRLDLLGSPLRVSVVEPGMVETEFSEVRFSGDKTAAKSVYAGLTPLRAEDVAASILHCATAPAHVNIDEIIIMPVAQAAVTAVHRETI